MPIRLLIFFASLLFNVSQCGSVMSFCGVAEHIEMTNDLMGIVENCSPAKIVCGARDQRILMNSRVVLDY
ncbi:unnamed protein product [Caenorhabditis bovis]|uniref:Uncharacterized protein n=1 Tax=Caenorhabditis bovis TaxID=2654633 RepID=A0A8S1F7K6_9PELO|nr:unnamed protein product [Caenorhabditis bovis]